MSTDLLNGIAKYLIALVVVVGCFVLIYSGHSADQTQPWSAIALIVGWLIRDSAANASTANVARIVAASQPAP